MDPAFLSRLQFALTIAFHYIYPPLSIGLGVMLVIMEATVAQDRQPALPPDGALLGRGSSALTFAIGVATGIVMEFEFGTNWATYSRFVGDVFGSALAAEGIFAFFLESGFLAVLLFGWDRVGPRHAFLRDRAWSAWARTSARSGSWWPTPGCRRRPGYHIVGEAARPRGRRSPTSGRWCSTRRRWTGWLTRCCGAWQAGAFLVV